MFYRNTTDNSSRNIRIVSLAAGLALATVAVISGGEILKENSHTNNTSVTPRIERNVSQFGTAADAVYAAQGIEVSSPFVVAPEPDYWVESLRPVTNTTTADEGLYLGIGQPSVGQSFSTQADAVYAAESLRPVTNTTDADEGLYLGIGQPSVGQSFNTQADAVYGAESLRPASNATVADDGLYLGIGQPSVGQSFSTAADAVYASQPVVTRQVASAVTSTNADAFFGLGQSGEGAESQSPLFGSLADADYASR
jgi:hypothetical protein